MPSISDRFKAAMEEKPVLLFRLWSFQMNIIIEGFNCEMTEDDLYDYLYSLAKHVFRKWNIVTFITMHEHTNRPLREEFIIAPSETLEEWLALKSYMQAYPPYKNAPRLDSGA